MFTAEFYTQNRAKLLSLLPTDSLVVVAGHTKLHKVADMSFPFEQDSNFRYLTGYNEPNAILVYSHDQSLLIVDDRSDFTSLWDGELSEQQILESTGVDRVIGQKAGWTELKELLGHHRQIAIAEPQQVTQWTGVINPARAKLKTKLKRQMSKQAVFTDVRPFLAQMRVIKQVPEIAAMQTAADITAKGYAAVAAIFSEAKYEYELQAAFSQAFISAGEDHAYDPIIASGPRSCILHYTENNQEIADNFVLFDVGAKASGYMCDVSRTMRRPGVNQRVQDVYDSVLRVQAKTIDHVKAGMSFVEMDAFMRERTAEELVELGLSKKANIKDTYTYLPHSSHFIGVDVHDVGNYKEPLRKNMIFTVEPGIYIPDEGIGVRIEDVIQITSTGVHNLTKAITK